MSRQDEIEESTSVVRGLLCALVLMAVLTLVVVVTVALVGWGWVLLGALAVAAVSGVWLDIVRRSAGRSP